MLLPSLAFLAQYCQIFTRKASLEPVGRLMRGPMSQQKKDPPLPLPLLKPKQRREEVKAVLVGVVGVALVGVLQEVGHHEGVDRQGKQRRLQRRQRRLVVLRLLLPPPRHLLPLRHIQQQQTLSELMQRRRPKRHRMQRHPQYVAPHEEVEKQSNFV